MHKISERVCVRAAVNIVILQCAFSMGNIGLHTTTHMLHILGMIVGSLLCTSIGDYIVKSMQLVVTLCCLEKNDKKK